jgi:hypothetical protein
VEMSNMEVIGIFVKDILANETDNDHDHGEE